MNDEDAIGQQSNDIRGPTRIYLIVGGRMISNDGNLLLFVNIFSILLLK